MPANFVVMDLERVSLGCKELSVIFGRPFMATTGAKVDIKAETLSMNVIRKMIKYEIFKTARYSNEEPECLMMDVLDEPFQRTFEVCYSHDFLDLVFTNDTCMSINYLQDPLTRDVMQYMITSMEATPSYRGKYDPKFESLLVSN